ncbi:hypothetical protein D3C76_1842290 [compost metagenome]
MHGRLPEEAGGAFVANEKLQDWCQIGLGPGERNLIRAGQVVDPDRQALTVAVVVLGGEHVGLHVTA